VHSTRFLSALRFDNKKGQKIALNIRINFKID